VRPYRFVSASSSQNSFTVSAINLHRVARQQQGQRAKTALHRTCDADRLVTANDGIDARRQFAQVIGFDEVVVGAEVEHADAVVAKAPSGRHDHRRRVSAGAHVLQAVVTGGFGQAEVEDDAVVAERRDQPEQLVAVLHPFDGVAIAHHEDAGRKPEIGIVFSQQQSHLFFSAPQSCPGPNPSRHLQRIETLRRVGGTARQWGSP
jgi:hypothetical protein